MSRPPASVIKSTPVSGQIKLKTLPFLVLTIEKHLKISFPHSSMILGRPTLGLFKM